MKFFVKKVLEFLCFFFLFIGLLKFLSSFKMLVMLISLELCSIMIFFLLISFLGGSVNIGLSSVFLVFVVSESVAILISMVGVFLKGSNLINSLFLSKF